MYWLYYNQDFTINDKKANFFQLRLKSTPLFLFPSFYIEIRLIKIVAIWKQIAYTHAVFDILIFNNLANIRVKLQNEFYQMTSPKKKRPTTESARSNFSRGYRPL